jgi:tryptophan synthase beta chain
MSQPIQFLLRAEEMPTHWYNLQADYPEPLPPPLHPGTKQPISPDMMAPLFPETLVAQEMSTERMIEIPQEVRDVYALYRPTPLLRAVRLEKALQTPAHIYYKYEGVSPAGSHKPNTAIPQAYYNKLAGTKRLATETGAGQWGSSLAMACQVFGLECTIYMVKVSFHQKPYRKLLMQTYGANVFASPSEQTEFGRRVLAETPESNGSLGIAISEAIEDTVKTPHTKYALGSVLNHVCLHQSIIGEETIRQMAMAGEAPDMVFGCAGGGSNFAGIAFPFVRENLAGRTKTRIVAVEPSSCPSLTQGELRYDFGDTAETTPLMMMYTLGHKFMPPSIHAGGLRYHGMAPMVSHCMKLGLIEARAVAQTKVFEAGVLFARTEGLVPAPESSHAISAVIDEAVKCREEGKKRVLVFNLSGNGLLDLAAYDTYLSGQMTDGNGAS